MSQGQERKCLHEQPTEGIKEHGPHIQLSAGGRTAEN